MPPSPPNSALSRFTGRPHWRREVGYAAGAVVLAAAAALALIFPNDDPIVAEHPIARAGHKLVRVGFSDLPDFRDDDMAAAFQAFIRSCAKGDNEGGLANACLSALALAERPEKAADGAAIETFFTETFRPYRIEPASGEGLITAYYEPVVAGSRTKTERFSTPLYALPEGFVRVTDDNRPEGWDADLSWGRLTEAGLVPTPTRAEIDDGALAGLLEPLVYVENAVEAFYIHIQGSTRIALPDGETMRVGYAGKNGHPYSSVGKAMQARGVVPPGGLSMDGMRDYFLADPERGKKWMQENRSFIFFREIRDLSPELGPIGGEGVPLTAGRSIAVDTRFHAYGTPIYIDAMPQIGPDRAPGAFRRLMIAQDTGSAIGGPARADLFWGTGTEAGSMAGGIKASGTFYVLLPKS